MLSLLRRPSVELTLLAVLLAVAGLVYARSLHQALNYDEGNYLASLDALRHGQRLGTDVFLDQPPGWYGLLQLAALVFGNTVAGVRAAMLAVSLLGLVAAWACGRALAGPAGGLGAAFLLAVAPPYPTLAAAVESDPPSTVLALCAVAIALYAYRGRTRPALATAAGVVLALAISVKLFAVVAVPVVALLALRRGLRAALWPSAGAAAVVAAFAVGYRHALSQVWTGTVGAHLNARHGTEILGHSNLYRVLHTPDVHTPYGLLSLSAIAAAVWLLTRSAGRRSVVRLWPLWLLVAGSAVFTLEMRPLLDHHLVLLAATLAVAAGATLGAAAPFVPGRAQLPLVLLFALALAAGFVQQRRELVRNDVPDPPDVRWAVRQVDALTRPGERIAGDIPAVAYLAHRRMPGQLIDSSIARIQDEYLKPEDAVRLIRTSGVRVVVVGRLYRTKPAIVAGIAASFPTRIRHGEITIYVRGAR
ncbi:MAG TPA: glycosyltransferase family 39 protein [Gaiellaceae bacterium]|nr:glycosyltransferase family 39 protein [Gaiellaceae bacterium]